jgi:hypothetical protein
MKLPNPLPRLSAALSSGWSALDQRLGGGWPADGLTEILGRGRSTLALSAVRQAQSAGVPAAWVDGARAFCPATAGVDLERLTLVCPELTPEPAGATATATAGATACAPAGVMASATAGETVGVPPGPAAGAVAGALAPERERRPRRAGAGALLAADLLLRSRAFGLIVLDLPSGSSALATWFRLARQAQRSACCLLLLTPGESALAGSASRLTVCVALRLPACARWEPTPTPALDVSVLRRRGSSLSGSLFLDLARGP